MERERGFEHVEHTADLGIRAWGPDTGAAFGEAARGLFAYMVKVEDASPDRDVLIDMMADSPERLLHTFLEDLLFRHQTELLVPSEFDVSVARMPSGAWRLGARVGAEPLDPERHGHVHEVKAVTFHGIRVKTGPPAETFVLVDI